jgi:hypothetical protein
MTADRGWTHDPRPDLDADEVEAARRRWREVRHARPLPRLDELGGGRVIELPRRTYDTDARTDALAALGYPVTRYPVPVPDLDPLPDDPGQCAQCQIRQARPGSPYCSRLCWVLALAQRLRLLARRLA